MSGVISSVVIDDQLQRSAVSFWKFLDAVGQGELMVPYTDGIVDRHGLYDEYANWMRQQNRAGELSCGSFLRLLDTHMRHLTQITTFMIQAKERAENHRGQFGALATWFRECLMEKKSLNAVPRNGTATWVSGPSTNEVEWYSSYEVADLYALYMTYCVTRAILTKYRFQLSGFAEALAGILPRNHTVKSMERLWVPWIISSFIREWPAIERPKSTTEINGKDEKQDTDDDTDVSEMSVGETNGVKSNTTPARVPKVQPANPGAPSKVVPSRSQGRGVSVPRSLESEFKNVNARVDNKASMFWSPKLPAKVYGLGDRGFDFIREDLRGKSIMLILLFIGDKSDLPKHCIQPEGKRKTPCLGMWSLAKLFLGPFGQDDEAKTTIIWYDRWTGKEWVPTKGSYSTEETVSLRDHLIGWFDAAERPCTFLEHEQRQLENAAFQIGFEEDSKGNYSSAYSPYRRYKRVPWQNQSRTHNYRATLPPNWLSLPSDWLSRACKAYIDELRPESMVESQTQLEIHEDSDTDTDELDVKHQSEKEKAQAKTARMRTRPVYVPLQGDDVYFKVPCFPNLWRYGVVVSRDGINEMGSSVICGGVKHDNLYPVPNTDIRTRASAPNTHEHKCVDFRVCGCPVGEQVEACVMLPRACSSMLICGCIEHPEIVRVVNNVVDQMQTDSEPEPMQTDSKEREDKTARMITVASPHFDTQPESEQPHYDMDNCPEFAAQQIHAAHNDCPGFQLAQSTDVSKAHSKQSQSQSQSMAVSEDEDVEAFMRRQDEAHAVTQQRRLKRKYSLIVSVDEPDKATEVSKKKPNSGAKQVAV